MHHAILMEAERRPRPLPTGSIRFIANAAGGLLPVLATNLKEAFDAVILTSYGMTECMPISSPPQSYRLDPTGTSGISVGPDVLIVDIDDGAKPLPNGAKGNIMVRGPPCFGGYENNGTANEESFFTINGQPGWFNTGGKLHDLINKIFASRS
jgi:acyl-CoA synthetase (AMP-forming)/AMP-acid ligase II